MRQKHDILVYRFWEASGNSGYRKIKPFAQSSLEGDDPQVRRAYISLISNSKGNSVSYIHSR